LGGTWGVLDDKRMPGKESIGNWNGQLSGGKVSSKKISRGKGGLTEKKVAHRKNRRVRKSKNRRKAPRGRFGYLGEGVPEKIPGNLGTRGPIRSGGGGTGFCDRVLVEWWYGDTHDLELQTRTQERGRTCGRPASTRET